MAGYSGTPLWKKLGVKPGSRVLLAHADPGWSIPDAPDGVVWVEDHGTDEGPLDLVLAFYRTVADYVAELDDLAERIFPAGALWIAWPRKAAGHVSDLGDNVIRNTALERGGIVDVKVAAVDEDWSGLKLVWRVEQRTR
ncbi:dipeptidase [Diaminobutyricibacter tongyongensis]|uniref:Dipeptidase n=1 Tax=Leifsonia tongyongensis TaxID=1268043 RepID=A0A6L9XV65_9MICO|nr:dipeptidase [Diaminobutyricibacter tongyongensis]NEN04898.1 dipeptidase [Diaminobutyricibacter tongyongensis]